MNFILKLTLSEIVKNKSKVLIAIIVTLILFMSAFTLCNISSALPENFYNYYEEYMHDTIGVHIANADEELYNRRNRYFIVFNANLDIALNNYSLAFHGKQQPAYEEIKDGEYIVSTYYFNNSILAKNIDEPNKYIDFFEQGNVWNDTFSEEGIWLADFAAENLGAMVGDNIEYKYANTTIYLQVKGIFNSDKVQKYKEDESGIRMNKHIFFITETSAKKILFESKTTFSAYGVVGKIDKLYKVYNELHGQYSLSEGTAFSMIAQVKNTQIICMIVGIIMIICGIIIMLNFINMIISQNIKHISLLRILGTSTFRIMLAYYIIFMLLITIVCLISWMTLPLYNYIVSIYCAGMGYPFVVDINYWVVAGVFAVCYLVVSLVMLVRWQIMEKTPPGLNILEED